jgi:hypothetical protein
MSYIGGLALLFIVLVGGAFGLFMIFSHTDMTGPVDSGGLIPNESDNVTRQAVVSATPALTTLAGWLVMIVGILFVFAIVVYMISNNAPRNSYRR